MLRLFFLTSHIYDECNFLKNGRTQEYWVCCVVVVCHGVVMYCGVLLFVVWCFCGVWLRIVVFFVLCGVWRFWCVTVLFCVPRCGAELWCVMSCYWGYYEDLTTICDTIVPQILNLTYHCIDYKWRHQLYRKQWPHDSIVDSLNLSCTYQLPNGFIGVPSNVFNYFQRLYCVGIVNAVFGQVF